MEGLSPLLTCLIANFSTDKKDWQNVFHKFCDTNYLFLIVVLLSLIDTGVLFLNEVN